MSVLEFNRTDLVPRELLPYNIRLLLHVYDSFLRFVFVPLRNNVDIVTAETMNVFVSMTTCLPLL